MRIAYVFIGITYKESFESINNAGHNLKPTTVDFRETYPNVKENLIDPFVNQGHNVDTFFVTYHNLMEDELHKYYNPKKILYVDYVDNTDKKLMTQNLLKNRIIWKDMIEETENNENFKYDFIIVTRSDLYFYKKTTEVGIDYEYFNIILYHLNGTIFSSDDNWIGIPRTKVDYYVDKLTLLINDNKNGVSDGGDQVMNSHGIGKYIIEGGETIKYLFGAHEGNGNDYPFFKFLRDVRKYSNINELITIPMRRIFHYEEEYKSGRGVYIERIAPYRHQFKMFMKDF
jgi:hypothetical protein